MNRFLARSTSDFSEKFMMVSIDPPSGIPSSLTCTLASFARSSMAGYSLLDGDGDHGADLHLELQVEVERHDLDPHEVALNAGIPVGLGVDLTVDLHDELRQLGHVVDRDEPPGADRELS